MFNQLKNLQSIPLLTFLVHFSTPSAEVMKDLYEYKNPATGKSAALLSKETYDIIEQHADVSGEYDCFFCFFFIFVLSTGFHSRYTHICFTQFFDQHIIYERDFNFNFFGFKVSTAFLGCIHSAA